MNRRILVVLFGVICVALIFQFFFRYQYIKDGDVVTRIDRITGSSCVLPCIKFDFKPQPQSVIIGDTRAIQSAENQYDAASLVRQWSSSGVYEWRVDGEFNNEYVAYNAAANGASANNMDYPIREVCYCNSSGTGYRWEVHLDTGEVFRIDGNAVLESRYNIHPVKNF